ncbi:MAG: ribose-5-phosphate isomerase [Candidatus Moraniibacteriota bacterium]|nr:MAG: ribose-5-phosphate isomerase [Candidatus Moranbacteria bacterium]
MNIYLGADHAGYFMKNVVKTFLASDARYTVVDCGADTFDKDDDYPAVMAAVAQRVADDAHGGIDSRGILFGGSGQGEAMVANRTKGVRAVVFYGGPKEIITLSREHNNANVLSIGARFIPEKDIEDIVHLWLDTPFPGAERHVRRIAQIDTLD